MTTEKTQISCPPEYSLIKPWEADLELPEHRWGKFFLADRNIPDFVFSKPSSIMETRIEFLVNQFLYKNRRWVICFCDSASYVRTLSYYVLASFVMSTKLSAEIAGPKELVEFTFNKHTDEFSQDPPIQSCSLLIFPPFDPLYPGIQKARPRLLELLSDRKIKKKPFLFSIFTDKLPANTKDIPKFSMQLIDFFGTPAKDLFCSNEVKFIVLKGE